MNKNEIMIMFRNNKHILHEYGVRRIGLFGSYVRGEQNTRSDVDVLVEFEKGKKTYKNFIHLCFYLDSMLGRRADVITSESISPFIKPYIDKEVVYEELY